MKKTKNTGNQVRFRNVLAASVALIAFTLSACSGGTDSQLEESTSMQPEGASLLPPAEEITNYPLSLNSPYGETVLQERPERVATIGTSVGDTELAIALGVTPVTAAERGWSQATYLADAVPGEIETIFETEGVGDFPIETIAAAKPDLIVVFGYDLADDYEQLSTIAPILTEPEGGAGKAWSGQWKENLTLLGEALDLQDAASSVLNEYDSHIAAVKNENPEFNGTSLSYGVWFGGDYGFIYQSVPDANPSNTFEEIGFSLSDSAADFGDGGTVSDELVSMIDADVLLIGDVSPTYTNGDSSLSEFTSTQLFQNLPVTQNDRVAILEDTALPVSWGLTSGGPIGIRFALDTIVPLLSETLNR